MAKENNNTIRCQVCGHHNLVGALICENCGSMLSREVRTGTRNLHAEMPEFNGSSEAFIMAGSDVFEQGMKLRVEVEGAKDRRIMITPTSDANVMGRRDNTTRQKPAVDLEDYEGYRMGVSRRHAILRLEPDSKLTIQDYGSANGTFLNGVRLPAHQPAQLQDGDELRLGHLRMRVYFVRRQEQQDA